MEFIGIDFETFYDEEFTLKKLSTSAYVFDPRFEVIGVGVIFRGKRYWMEEYQFRKFAASVDWTKYGVLCHHAHFDGLILAHHYGVFPGYWLDTLSMGRALHGVNAGGSLEALMQRYEVGRKLTDRLLNAKGKRRADFTPQEYAEYGEYCLNDNEGTLAIFQKMLLAFPRPELDLIDLTIRMFTEPVLVLDQQMMAEYQREEIARKNELLTDAFDPDIDRAHVTPEMLEAWAKGLRSGDKFADILRGYGIEPPMKNSPTAKQEDGITPKVIYAFAKTDPGMQELLEHEDDDVRILAEARVSVRSTLNESRTARMILLGEGGRPLPVYLKYAAAHTIRWGGGDKVNWQNLEKTNKKNPKKGMIRKAVRAPQRMKIVKADASQVEARYNAWHAGELSLVAQFRNGEDIYSNFATDAYGRPVDRKKNPEDELPGQVAKICVLGLGYRMGWLKLAGEMLMGRGGAPKVQFDRSYIERLNIDPGKFLSNPYNVKSIHEMPSRLPLADRMIHCCVTNYFVERYRSKYKMIAQNWDFWDEVIQWMFSGRNYGPVGYLGILTHVEDGLRLPNGFTLRYQHIEYKKGKDGGFTHLSGRGKRTKLHGGVIVENYTQALCRQIVADAMVRLTWKRKRAGLHPYKIAQTEHDAITCVVPEEQAGECLNDLMREISTAPKWAPDLPLAAEGGIYDTMGG